MGRHVDDALDRVGRLGTAGAAIGTRGRRVGEHARGLDVDRRRGVRAGQAADVVGARAGAPRRDVGADVERDRDAQRQELALRVERQLGGRDVVAPVLVGHEPFAPIGGPLDRAAEPLGRPQHERVLRIGAAAHPEASPDLTGDHAQMALGDPEDLIGEELAQPVRRLDSGVERVTPGAPIPLADRGARLERRRGHSRDDELEARDVRGAGEPAGHRVTIAGLPDERDVVGSLRPHRRRAGARHLGGRGHRGQRLVVDGHELRGVDGL